MKKIQDLTGQKFGRLTVIKRVENSKHGHIMYLCQCECGKQKNIIASSLLSGHTKSCGCLNKEVITKHGLIHHRIRSIYKGMKERCYNSHCKKFKYYGGKRIKICDEWLNDLKNFYNWAMINGYQDNLTIDRIDSNGNYEPNNCRWIDMKMQLRNTSRTKMITFNNETMCLKDWAKKLKINYRTLQYRLSNGWTIEETLTTKGNIKCN